MWPRTPLFSATGSPRRERQDSAAQRAREEPWEHAGRRHPGALHSAQEIDRQFTKRMENVFESLADNRQTIDRQLTDN